MGFLNIFVSKNIHNSNTKVTNNNQPTKKNVVKIYVLNIMGFLVSLPLKLIYNRNEDYPQTRLAENTSAKNQ